MVVPRSHKFESCHGSYEGALIIDASAISAEILAAIMGLEHWHDKIAFNGTRQSCLWYRIPDNTKTLERELVSGQTDIY